MSTFWMFMQTRVLFIALISSILSTTPVVKVGSGRFSLSKIILSKVCALLLVYLITRYGCSLLYALAASHLLFKTESIIM